MNEEDYDTEGQTPTKDSESYEIRVEGHLDGHWSEWFDAMTLTQVEGGQTLLCGPIRDQAALHGILAKIRDLGLNLISVNRVGAGGEMTSTSF